MFSKFCPATAPPMCDATVVGCAARAAKGAWQRGRGSHGTTLSEIQSLAKQIFGRSAHLNSVIPTAGILPFHHI